MLAFRELCPCLMLCWKFSYPNYKPILFGSMRCLFSFPLLPILNIRRSKHCNFIYSTSGNWAITKHYVKGWCKYMKNIKRVHDLQKHNPAMKQLSNPGRQEKIACQMLVRENYRGPLMWEIRWGEIGWGGPYGLPKNRKYTSRSWRRGQLTWTGARRPELAWFFHWQWSCLVFFSHYA